MLLSHSTSVGTGPHREITISNSFQTGIRDRAVMAVDQQQVALVVGLFGMTGQMNLPDMRQRKVGQIVQRREAVVGGGHEDVVDVEQQAASGAPRDARG